MNLAQESLIVLSFLFQLVKYSSPTVLTLKPTQLEKYLPIFSDNIIQLIFCEIENVKS